MLNLSGYQIIEEISANSKCVVYRAIRSSDRSPVILKCLQSEEIAAGEIARLQHEYEIAKNLHIAGIVQPLAFLNDNHYPVLILSDFGGISLKDFIKKCKLSLKKFLAIAIQLAQTLGELHQENIIHKDIKPSNIIIKPETLEVRITDFAIATQLTRESAIVTHPNLLEGTLAYMSPEQTGRMNRAIDYRSDFYSLGVTFYEILAGELPCYADDPMEMVYCHIAKQPVPLKKADGRGLVAEGEEGEMREIPAAISDIVMKLLAKTAEDRYQSAFGLKADLENCLNQLLEKGEIEEFELGQRDFSGQLQIPQKLYGRSTQLAQLLVAFERVCWGKTEMMLVAGYSGIGKSALVREIHKPLVRYRGYFISGKFDQYKRNIPFEPLVEAFRDLIRQLLSESELQIATWKQKLAEALGANGQVIIDVIPEVEMIVGKQPPVPELAAAESQNRFNLVFQKFIGVFRQKDHPLVIFLDDLQWADSASLKLIQLLMTERDSRYLLLIGAYRDNEVDARHPLTMTLEEIQKSGASVNTITIQALELRHVNELIADALSCHPNLAKPLAELVLSKTGGNPFFVTQLLKSLYRENLLIFDFSKGAWQWDIERLQGVGITDNVVELMVKQIQKLSEAAQNILKLAACIGNRFKLAILSVVNEKSIKDTAAELWEAIQAGLILPESNNYTVSRLISESNERRSPASEWEYKFLHDRVQQAAYGLISEAEKQSTHLKIGQLLLNNTPESELEEKIFEIVNHLNYGIDLISQQTERDELARLNLMAGRKAKSAIAYAAATAYLASGLRLLADNHWETQYNLTLALHEEAAEVAYLNGNFERQAEFVAIVQAKAKTILDAVKAYEIQIQAYSAQSKLKEGLLTGLKVLKLLGVEFPEKASQADVIQAIAETQAVLQEKQLSDLIDLPEMTDSGTIAAMRILLSLSAAFYITSPELFPLMACKLVTLSLQQGNAAESAYGYAIYGLLLCGIVRDIELGFQFGQVALSLSDIFNRKELTCKVELAVFDTIWIWKKHLRKTIKPIQNIYEYGLEIGSLEYAGYAIGFVNLHSFFLGRELCEVEKKMAIDSQNLEKINQKVSLYYNQLYRQSVLNLLGRSENPCEFMGEAYNEKEMLPLHQQEGNRYAICVLYIQKLFLGVLFHKAEIALENSILAAQYSDAIVGQAHVYLFNLYDSLARLGIFNEVSPAKRESLLERVAANQELMRLWAQHAPMNFQHKFELVEAERCRVLGKNSEAMDLYDRAIAGAKENEYIQEEALANEMAARFYLCLGKTKIAKVYMQDAREGYQRWGAIAKVKHLEETYPKLLPIKFEKDLTSTGSSKPSSGSGETLDLTTVLKASQAIAGEIVLDSLLSKLMLIVIENAGAQSGVLLLNREGKLFVEAAADKTSVTALQSIPIEDSSLSDARYPMPLALINYVARTQEDVVLNDASREGNFTSDRYIIERQPKSIICTPILGQGKLIGILYIENNLTTGAFTAGRLEVLKLLCSQAAISLENARLYAFLEQKVEERTLELNEKNQRLTREIEERQRVEEALRFSEERFRAIFESTADQIAVWDKNVNCLYANRAMLEPINIKAEQAIGKSMAEIYKFSEASLLWSDRVKEVFKTCKSMHVEDTRIVGERAKYSEATLSPIKDLTGNVFAVGIVYRDVTERKEAEIALRQSEERYRAVVEDQTELICRFKTDGTLTFVNDAYCRYFNKLREELIGYSFMPAIPDEDRLKIEQKLASLNSDNPIGTIEHRVLFGKLERWHQWTDRAIFDEAGKFIEFQAVGRDISDRKLAEKQLQENYSLLRGLVEGTSDAVFVKDLQGCYLTINSAFARNFNKSIEEIIGKDDFQLWPEMAGHFRESDRQAIATKEAQIVEELVPINGILRTFLVTKNLWRDEGGNILGLIGIARDISDRKQAEEALRKSENCFRSMFERHNSIMLSIDPTSGIIVECNRAAAAFYGYPLNTLRGMNIHDINQFSPELIQQQMVKATSGTQNYFTFPHKLASGEIRWVEVHSSPIEYEGKQLLFSVIHDITARLRAEEALALSEQKYRNLVETSQEMIFSCDAEGRFTFVNQAVKRIHGCEPEEMIGRPFTDFEPPEQIAKDREVYARLLAGESFFQYESVHLAKDGRPINLLVNAIALFDAEGNIIGTTGTASDITERKRTEEILRESERRLFQILDAIPVGVFVSDTSGKPYYLNEQSQKLLGKGIMEGAKSDTLADVHQAYIAGTKELYPPNKMPLVRALSGESCQIDDMEIHQPNKIIALTVWGTPILDKNGAVEYGVASFVDISDRKRAEEALQKAKEAADAASRAKGEFLSKMSHELRTPLNAILGFTQVLNRDSSLTLQQQGYLGIINRAGEHLLTLINDVLEMSKIEAGKLELNKNTFDLYRLLNSLQEMLQLKAESKGLQLVFDIAQNVPQWVKTDESKLRQVLINLLGNAVKFTESGNVTLRVVGGEYLGDNLAILPKNSSSDIPLLRLGFSVEDTGLGIAPEELATIFDPFVQTETGRKSQSGTGLGLPISRQFVQLMGGDIAVSSTVGEGTIFTFEIQIRGAEVREVPTQKSPLRAIALQPNQPTYRILVVEDKWESRLLLVNLLAPLGFEVREAVNGQEAVTIWESWQPQLIWMDMQMPVMDGYEATKLIKATTKGQQTAIIALTASAFEENRATVLSTGCDDFVSKPFREEVILDKMAEYLGVHYIYEETALKKDATASLREKSAKMELTKEALAALPAEWIAQLHQAACELDEEAIASLADAIRSSEVALADALTDLAKKLRFDKIVELTQRAPQ